jgi:hypothetical protein
MLFSTKHSVLATVNDKMLEKILQKAPLTKFVRPYLMHNFTVFVCTYLYIDLNGIKGVDICISKNWQWFVFHLR